jgi:hypothetical protein
MTPLVRQLQSRRLPFVALCAALTALALVGTALSAGSTVSRFQFEESVSFPTALPECLPADLVGTLVGMEITDGQAVETSSGALEVQGTTSFDYRVDFPDGRYVIGSAPGHFDFHVSPGGTVVTTSVVREPRTVYSAGGDPVGSGTIHANSHMTFRDANGNGLPDPGEITSSVDRFSFTCK